MPAETAPVLNPYWQQTARHLIDQMQPGSAFHWDTDASRWVGQAIAVMAEALRLAGDESGISAITRADTPVIDDHRYSPDCSCPDCAAVRA